MSARFVIVTDDDQYSKGTSRSFLELGVSEVRLGSYSHEGDYVVLNFEQGVEVSIPEARVVRIVEQEQPEAGGR
ncbi:hypothetical protein OHB04_02495 [Streptomyces sp. NBC_01775]|uniref:hypothetical protein n=1 Tax=Streptomyces sp. NBC_01775 TaxID=2975939 RepID=UPI002DD9C7C5|nr:hypothetical protein [Streptomyces sp. NBC_01775]WSB74763.1 hypothetical protein OHB04_02495 [Streptomyces sp. NBC_01775]